jgi:hypothetical protein
MWNSPETFDEDLDEIEEPEIVLEKPRKRTRRTKDESRETVEYVTKDEMWNELYNYYKSLGDDYDWETQKPHRKDTFPPISKRLTVIINDISTKMGYRANFCNYSWIDEMMGDARLKMVKAIRDCSFKCYTIAEIIDTVIDSDNQTIIYYIDKKGKTQDKAQEESDEFFTENNKNFIKFKANPFGYFSRITSHSFLNRMKKENSLEETKRAFQTKTWDELYANENFRNVRRPKYIDSDENDGMFEE